MGMSDTDSIKYGYEDPDVVIASNHDNADGHRPHGRTPRRSSMKQEGRPRRASIQLGGEMEYELPGHVKVKRRTSIDFNHEDYPIERLSTSGNVEFKELWLQRDEYDVIAKSNMKIVKAIEKGTDKNFHFRGLEGMMNAKAHDQTVGEAKQCVLAEQNSQREFGTFDEERVMESYKFATLQSKLDAVERGQSDQAEIEVELKKHRKMMRRLSA